MVRLSGFAGLLLIASLAQAGQARPPAEKYGLPDLVALALQHTQLLGSHDARIEEKRLSAAQARVWPGSSVEFSFGRRQEGSASGPGYELSLAQPLPISGKPGLAGGLRDLEAQSWKVQRQAAKLSVALSVARLSYEYTSNRRKAAFAEKRQARFELIQEYMSGRVFPTPQRKAERGIVENRLKILFSETIQSRAGFKASLEKLRVFVPLEPGTQPDIEVPWLAGTRELDAKEWLTRALENNPSLQAQRIAVQSAGLEKTLASREGLPEPSLIASYEEGKAETTEKNYGLGLSLAFPSWNHNRSGIKSSEKRRLAEERLLGFEEARLKAELPRALVEYEAARQIVLKYPQTILPELEAQLREAEEGFRKGVVDLLTFLELDGSASEAFDRVLDAQQNLADRAAELLALRGEPDILTELGSF